MMITSLPCLSSQFRSAANWLLAALRSWLDAHGNEVIVIVCLVLGAWLAGQSIRVLAIEAAR